MARLQSLGVFSVELGGDAIVVLSDTPYSCTRRVLVCWCVLAAGEDGAL